jgi:hypothetical protein
MAIPTDLVTKGRWVVEIKGIEDMWATLTGGDESWEILKARHPVSDEHTNFKGPHSISPIVLSREYSPSRDSAVLDMVKDWKASGTKYRVSAYPVDDEKVPVGPSRIWDGCCVSNFKPPECDKNSDEWSMLELTLEPETVIQ